MVDTLHTSLETMRRGPPSMEEIVSGCLVDTTTSADTDLANCLSSSEEYIITRHGKAQL